VAFCRQHKINSKTFSSWLGNQARKEEQIATTKTDRKYSRPLLKNNALAVDA
jgi:hypothetical protein